MLFHHNGILKHYNKEKGGYFANLPDLAYCYRNIVWAESGRESKTK